jgi:hypothetical protein
MSVAILAVKPKNGGSPPKDKIKVDREIFEKKLMLEKLISAVVERLKIHIIKIIGVKLIKYTEK